MPALPRADVRAPSRSGRQRGMTLIELMIVFAIISIMAAISVPLFLGVKDKSIWGTAYANLGVIRSALAAYAANQDSNKYPAAVTWADLSTPGGILRNAQLPQDKYAAKLSEFTYSTNAECSTFVIVGTVFNRYGDTITATPQGITPREYNH